MKKALTNFVFVVILFTTKISFGQSPIVRQLEPNYFTAGVPSMSFYPVALIGRQRCPEWCWAASCQMVLNFHGLYVT